MKEKVKALQFFIPKPSSGEGTIIINSGIAAGFPSPADDFKQNRISLDNELVKNKEATFFARVSGQSMIGAERTSITFSNTSTLTLKMNYFNIA